MENTQNTFKYSVKERRSRILIAVCGEKMFYILELSQFEHELGDENLKESPDGYGEGENSHIINGWRIIRVNCFTCRLYLLSRKDFLSF